MTDPAEIRAEGRRQSEPVAHDPRCPVMDGHVDNCTCESPAEALADPDPEPAESWSCPGCGAVWGKRTDGGPGPLAGFLPAPVGLTEDEQEAVGFFRWNAFPGTRMAIVLAALDRLSAAPDPT